MRLYFFGFLKVFFFNDFKKKFDFLIKKILRSSENLKFKNENFKQRVELKQIRSELKERKRNNEYTQSNSSSSFSPFVCCGSL